MDNLLLRDDASTKSGGSQLLSSVMSTVSSTAGPELLDGLPELKDGLRGPFADASSEVASFWGLLSLRPTFEAWLSLRLLGEVLESWRELSS